MPGTVLGCGDNMLNKGFAFVEPLHGKKKRQKINKYILKCQVGFNTTEQGEEVENDGRRRQF